MAKQRGHRANKPNDSFGTINNEQLYRGKYRDEVYHDEDEEATTDTDPSEEATPEDKVSFAKPREESETDYKKRYDDLKRHYDAKLEEWKQEKDDLSNAQQAGRNSGIKTSELPKTVVELTEFKPKYPDVYAVVETISSLQAENKLASLKQEVETLKGREKQLEVQSAYKELLNAHPDFVELRASEKFLAWLDEQPASIGDGIYKNNTDAKWASRVIDLYKSDTGTKTRKQFNRSDDSAAAVRIPNAKDVTDSARNKKVWKASEIGRLKPWEFEKLETELDSARAEGRIDFRS